MQNPLSKVLDEQSPVPTKLTAPEEAPGIFANKIRGTPKNWTAEMKSRVIMPIMCLIRRVSGRSRFSKQFREWVFAYQVLLL